jgi:hypothetical protein
MQGVLFGLFIDLDSAEKALAALHASGISPEATVLHHQDVPIAGAREERPGNARPRDEQGGLFAGLFHSLFDNGGEMNSSTSVTTVRQALHRGEYAVAVSTQDASEMAKAEEVFTACGAVLQLHPDAGPDSTPAASTHQ